MNETPSGIQNVSSSQAHPVEQYFGKLRSEVLLLLNNESNYAEKIRKLEEELNVYKRAYNDVDKERRQLENFKQNVVREKENLENQMKGFRVVILLDGDGAIFSADLIVQGKAGGHIAAQTLTNSAGQYLNSTFGSNQYQIWVYVFFNKRGLVDTFGRSGNALAKAKFEDFMMGFNQATERFLMVDVGDAKEAADAKIKARLEDEIRLPQTCKIIFGGCHDNGYATNLRSQITAGFRDKLILLRSYADMATGIAALELPAFSIPDLFLETKLVPQYHSHVPNFTSVPSNLSPRSRSDTQSATTQPVVSELSQDSNAVPEPPTGEAKCSIPASYSSAVQVIQKRVPTPDLDSSSSTESEGSDDLLERPFPPFTGSRHVNPNIPLSKHKPPPCTLFYLANCKHGADCKYGHDYLLEAEHFAEIRLNAKKAPCPAINKGEPCLWGDECCYGHYCSLSTKCHFFKQGRCKFSGADMHKEPKAHIDEKV